MDLNGYIKSEELARGVLDKKVVLDNKVLLFIFEFLDKDAYGQKLLEEMKRVFEVYICKEAEKNLMRIIKKVDLDIIMGKYRLKSLRE